MAPKKTKKADGVANASSPSPSQGEAAAPDRKQQQNMLNFLHYHATKGKNTQKATEASEALAVYRALTLPEDQQCHKHVNSCQSNC